MASTINATPGDGIVGKLRKTADNTNALTLQTSTTDSLAIDTAQNVTLSSTGALSVPSGTTAQRPSSPVAGMLRYNTTIPQLEIYINATWTALP
jgi:hypothetical protein